MKKLLALVLSLICLLTVTPTFAATFTDTVGENCENAVEVLSALGILEGKGEGVFAPADTLTRAEMAAIILRAMNVTPSTSGGKEFSDVPTTHWAYATIGSAYQMGIVNGTSDTTFAPDGIVTYEQAVKMVVSALGYTVQAEAIGGYPSGYLAKAAQLDILKGTLTGGNMTRGNMAILMFNALEAELSRRESYGDDTYTFTSDAAVTMLSYYLKVTHYRDKVTATPMARFDGETQRLLDDEVIAGGIVMKKGETNAQDMLGIQSDIYVKTKENSELPTILAIVPRASVRVVDLVSADIESISTVTELVYTDETGKEAKANISNAALIWNGREEEKSEARIKPETGTVRLISDTGADFDLMIVEAYTNHVVEHVNKDKGTVVFKTVNDPAITIDFDDNKLKTQLLDASGTPIDVTNLAEWDILSIAESDARHTSKSRRIYRANTVITGTITEISQNEITIDEETYPSDLVYGAVELGQNAAYYLDFTGSIAAVNTKFIGTGRTYGWLQNAAPTKGLDTTLQLKIFTEDGEWKVFKLADKISFNGTDGLDSLSLIGSQTSENLWAAGNAPSIWADGKIVPQLVAYKTNAEGFITEIETAANRSNPQTKDADKIGGDFSMDWYYGKLDGDGYANEHEFNGVTGDGNVKKNKVRYMNAGGLFFGRVRTDDNTKFFVIPLDASKDEAYMIRNAGNFYTEGTGYVAFYDVDDTYYCGAMVMHKYFDYDPTQGSGEDYDNIKLPVEESPVALITGKATVLGEDGEVLNALKMYTSQGAEVTAHYDEDFLLNYKSVNADITKDKAWFGAFSTNSAVTVTAETLGDATTRPDKYMLMRPEDLEPGDVIWYDMDEMGKLTAASVSHRVSYPVEVEFLAATTTGSFVATKKLDTYRNAHGRLRLYGTVQKALPTGPIVSTCLTNTLGLPVEDGEVNRTLFRSGKYVIWNKNTKTAQAATADDVQKDDKIFTFYEDYIGQRLVVIYR